MLHILVCIMQYLLYILIAMALDESIFLDVLHFPMKKTFKSHDLEATPMGGATSKLPSDVVVYSCWRDIGCASP